MDLLQFNLELVGKVTPGGGTLIATLQVLSVVNNIPCGRLKKLNTHIPAIHTAEMYKTTSQLTGSSIGVTAAWEKEPLKEYSHCCFENINQLKQSGTELGLLTN